jgi:hypothetical protein
MPLEWDLYYPNWMIEDGEPHRRTGEIFDWHSVEFWTLEALRPTNARSKSAIPAADYLYHVVAEVAYLSERACIIDFGLQAVRAPDPPSPHYKLGDYVTGIVGVGLPLRAEMLPEGISKTLARRWRVNAISADLTPYIAHPDNPRYFFRDESKVRYQAVESTDVLTTHAYILHCSEATSA